MASQFLKVALDRPVRYLQCGQFLAELGWQHHSMQHGQDVEVIIGLSGQIFIEVSGHHYTVEKGDVLTIFPEETIVGYLPTLEKSEFIWFHFMARGQLQLTDKFTVDSAVLPRNFHLSAGEKVMISAQQLLDMAHSEYYSALAADYAETMLLIELTNNYWQQQQQITSKPHDVNQIKEWIRVQMGQDLKVADVAAHFAINPDYLTRVFKKTVGITVKAYMNTVKLDFAKYLLLTTALSVEEISAQSFFEDPKYFMRLFKKKVHLTPSQYRQAYTHTFLNNQQVDPGVDVRQLLERVETSHKN
ncbi:AraC family transcriptional regulator [Lapidilactobacillus mulanensis]|uniref:AraC family transcriptional regulator n=1 Tax=Lapidilactobacillus mulanensis TaxID=2485999 RepID=A0ABW4DMA4_9LACO|nr:AraC family transcriptional regulator [Lapidilactobacillus mulanensis]